MTLNIIEDRQATIRQGATVLEGDRENAKYSLTGSDGAKRRTTTPNAINFTYVLQ